MVVNPGPSQRKRRQWKRLKCGLTGVWSVCHGKSTRLTTRFWRNGNKVNAAETNEEEEQSEIFRPHYQTQQKIIIQGITAGKEGRGRAARTWEKDIKEWTEKIRDSHKNGRWSRSVAHCYLHHSSAASSHLTRERQRERQRQIERERERMLLFGYYWFRPVHKTLITYSPFLF